MEFVNRLDGSQARVLIPAIPSFNPYGDNTGVDGLSWTRDGKWIAIAMQPGIGRGDPRGRIFIVPSAGGRLRRLVDCGSIGRSPPWTSDGTALYTLNFSEDYSGNYFLADIATGRLTPVAKEKVPKRPLVPLPAGSGQPHAAGGGRFFYYEAPVQWKPRLVKISGLVP